MTKPSHQWGGLLPADLDVIGGTYSVDRVTKVGTLCVVLTAQHAQLGTPVVVKVLRPELAENEDNVTRFLQVARQSALIEHDNVVQVMDFDRLANNGPPYFVMERLTGGTFRDLLILHGPPPIELALDYVVQACEGLAAGHRRGVVHGDVRPSKLFRTYRDNGTALIKVVDFALAQNLGHHGRRFGSRSTDADASSPEYRAPEQLAGVRSIEPPTDVWALGLILAQLLVGRHPFAEATSSEMFVAAVEEGPPSVRERHPYAPADLDELIQRCLRADPAGRPSEVALVANELRAISQRLPERSERETQPAPALRATPAPTSTGGRRHGRPESSPTSPRQRFLGAAMGSRRVTGGGSYSYVGKSGSDGIAADQPFPRSRRRRRQPPAPAEDAPTSAPEQPPPASREQPAPKSSQPRRPLRPSMPQEARVTAPGRSRPAKARARQVSTDPATPAARYDRPPASGASGAAPPAPKAPPPDEAIEFELPLSDPAPGSTPEGTPPGALRPLLEETASEELDVEPDFDVAPSAATGWDDSPVIDIDSSDPNQDTATGFDAAAEAAAAIEALAIDEPSPATEEAAAAAAPEEALIPAAATADDFELDFTPLQQDGHVSFPPDMPGSAPPAPVVLEERRPDTSAARAAAVTAPAFSPARREGPEDFGPYVLERCIGVGRWSEIFVARPKTGDVPARKLAIKRPRAGVHVDAHALERLAQRHEAADHPGLLQIYESGTVGGVPYLAVEHVEGIDVRRLLQAVPAIGRSIPYSVTALIVRRVAETLAALHAVSDETGAPFGLLHGDIRPSKVLLSLAGEVKLGTVSLALPTAGAPRSDQRDHKFDYQPPEELAGELLDPTSDLFSLGVVLGELLIGEPVFSGKGLEVLFAIQEADMAPLRDRAPMLPGGMFEVCEGALARFRSERYPDAGIFAAAVEPYEQSATRAPDEQLVEWVARARKASHVPDSAQIAATKPERTATTTLSAEIEAAHQALEEQRQAPPIKVRRAHSGLIGQLTLPQLMEAIATGSIGPDDEVNWSRQRFEPIREVEPLARHLLLTAPAMDGTVVDTTAPDHVYEARSTSMLEVLAQMRQCYATGMLLAQTQDEDPPRRREIFLQDGRLYNVRSSDPGDLLGEYLQQRGLIDRAAQAQALAALPAFDGNMGNALVGLGLLDAVEVYRALRQQARDRVAAVFTWMDARIDVYLSCEPPHVAFPLSLDLACSMMDGVLAASEHDPAGWLPSETAVLEPGPRLPPTESSDADGVPLAMRLLGSVASEHLTIAEAMVMLAELADTDTMTAAAAIVTGRALQWVAVREEG